MHFTFRARSTNYADYNCHIKAVELLTYNEFACMHIFSTCMIMCLLYFKGLNLEFFDIHCTKLASVIESQCSSTVRPNIIEKCK